MLVSRLLLELELLDRSCSAGRFTPRPRPAGSWNWRGGVSDMILSDGSDRIIFLCGGAYFIYPKEMTQPIKYSRNFSVRLKLLYSYLFLELHFRIT